MNWRDEAGSADVDPASAVAAVVRDEWSPLMAALMRDLGDLTAAEDAAQEAIEIALVKWHETEVPARPGAWILTVARRRAIDRLRRDQNRERKSEQLARLEQRQAADDLADWSTESSSLVDEQLQLIFGCCHPALGIEAQIALTLRCVAGIETPRIARAFLVADETMAQRIVRAKRKVKAAAIPFTVPPDEALFGRLSIVHHTIYLIFNEGYAGSAGEEVVDVDLCQEAIRLARLLAGLLHDDAETQGLLALLLLIHARAKGRTGADGATTVLLPDQDRSRWDRELIDEGVQVIESALRLKRPGPYQIQAAINALHDEAPAADNTDWRQIEVLYRGLLEFQPTPIVRLNHAVAVAMHRGPSEGLALIDALASDLDAYGHFHSARADLLRQLERRAEAVAAYERAVELTDNGPEQRFLRDRITELS